jgi:glycosyltransferase involved in cell wall biosynthesis
MKFGVVMQSGLSDGGAHNYEAEFLRLVRLGAEGLGIEIAVFVPKAFSKEDEDSVWTYKLSPLRMAVSHLRSNPLIQSFLALLGCRYTNLEKKARGLGVNALIFSSPNHIALGVVSLPIATTAWDFGHLDLPQASETSMNGLWQWRDELFSKTIPRSVTLYCDSDATAQAAVSKYRASSSRICKVGLLPTVIDSKPEFLDKPHFIYPAMYWPHKNHLMLLEAFKRWLSHTGADAYLVLTGSGKRSHEVGLKISELGLNENVIQAGLVERSRLFALVRGSLGLVMPSLMGPSNLPQLEASMLGVPCVISDIHKMNDLLPGVASVSASDPEAWSFAFDRLWNREIPVIEPSDLQAAALIQDSLKSLSKDVGPWIHSARRD